MVYDDDYDYERDYGVIMNQIMATTNPSKQRTTEDAMSAMSQTNNGALLIHPHSVPANVENFEPQVNLPVTLRHLLCQ
jgi:calcineurin-like phosphoesterase family protein